jgi:hypothetical protein
VAVVEAVKATLPETALEPRGPCSTPHDWRRKTAVGINTRDRARARQWAIDALLDGGRVRRTIGPETWSHWEPDSYYIGKARANRRDERAARL